MDYQELFQFIKSEYDINFLVYHSVEDFKPYPERVSTFSDEVKIRDFEHSMHPTPELFVTPDFGALVASLTPTSFVMY